jgi:hypothetical protein
MDTNMGRAFLTQQIQSDMAKHREVFVGMTEPDARFIFPKSDIENPMQAVFNTPMASDFSSAKSGKALLFTQSTLEEEEG